MGKIFSFTRKLCLITMASILLVFTIYWFELDDKLLKAFEPTFRKISDRVKGLSAV